MHILYSTQKLTNTGKVRANNQDAYGLILEWREPLGLTDADLQERGHLFAVADGMGGHAAGEVASQLAIETLFKTYYQAPWQNPRANLEAAIAAANEAILAEAKAHPQMAGMGTTLVAALYRPQEGWLIANVGDSRAYLFQSGRIEQVTQDHSWVAEQARSGVLTEAQAAHHPLRNVITRSLGGDEHVTPDFFHRDAHPGDIMLLCSDGLSNQVHQEEMRKLLKSYPLDEATQKLMELALERGAPDNVTLVLIQLVGGKQRRSRSILPWLALFAGVFILGGFLFWTYGRPQPPAATPAPVAQLATNTPTAVSTPSPLPSPATPPRPALSPTATSLTTAALPASSPLNTPSPSSPVIAAPVAVIPISGLEDAEGFIFVQGPAEIRRGDETAVVITHVDPNKAAPHAYIAILPENALAPRWLGAEQAAVGAQASPEANGQQLKTAWLLAPLGDRGDTFFLLWMSALGEQLVDVETPILLYTVNGRGGGDSLGVDTPAGQEGVPIAVLGRWRRASWPESLTFMVDQIFDYHPDEQRYLPRP